MNILNITANNPEQTEICVFTDTENFTTSWPCFSWHRKEIQKWLDEDNEIQSFETPEASATIITSVTRLQILEEIDARDLEETFFTVLQSNVKMLRRWNAATMIEKDHPLVTQFAALMNLDVEEFFLASSQR
jgi:hypothetical protein